MRVLGLIAAFASLIAGCGAPALPRVEEPAEQERRECTAALRFEEVEDVSGPDDNVRTAISLVLICEEEPRVMAPLGIAIGACYSTRPSEGVLLSATCWWGGEGAAFEIRQLGESLEARRVDIDEDTGIGEEHMVGTLHVPSGAVLRAL